MLDTRNQIALLKLQQLLPIATQKNTPFTILYTTKSFSLQKPLKNLLIPPHSYAKYNAETCIQIIFTEEGLQELRDIYKDIKALPSFLHNLLLGRPTPDRELILTNPDLCMWAKDFRFMIIPGGFNNNPETLKNNHRAMKNAPGGLSLVAWIMDPRLLISYGWGQKKEPSTAAFRNFLIENDKKCSNAPNYKYFHRSPSQESIRSLEEKWDGNPYLASILDLNSEHIEFLKMLRESSLTHLKDNYNVDLNNDLVSLYFHFPCGEPSITLHLHIRVNQGIHPVEKSRAFSLNEIITWLEANKPIHDLILVNPLYMENTKVIHDIFENAKKTTIREDQNPFILSSPYVSCKEEVLHLHDHPTNDLTLSI